MDFKRRAEMPRSRAPKVVDMFAGAGLLSHAFEREGFAIAAAYEQDPRAAATYARNVGSHIQIADIECAKCDVKCDVLVAGPPCQGFSTLGKRNALDPRNSLSNHVVRWVGDLKPKLVVIENVAAFLNAPIVRQIRARFEQLGYCVSTNLIDASDFGTPQNRLRSFLIASRIGTPELYGHPRKLPPSVREAWHGLSPKPNGKNWHYAPTPSSLALARMRVIPLGGDKRDIMRDAPHLTPPSWWRVVGDVTDVWGRMNWDEPSNTIRTTFINPSKGRYIHPEQNRVISLREGARLQGIPDGWEFVGTPYQVARQIGNGVPITLGRAVARAVGKLF